MSLLYRRLLRNPGLRLRLCLLSPVRLRLNHLRHNNALSSGRRMIIGHLIKISLHTPFPLLLLKKSFPFFHLPKTGTSPFPGLTVTAIPETARTFWSNPKFSQLCPAELRGYDSYKASAPLIKKPEGQSHCSFCHRPA